MVTGFDGFAAWKSIGIAIIVQVCPCDTDPLAHLKIKLLLSMVLGIDLNHSMWIFALFDATHRGSAWKESLGVTQESQRPIPTIQQFEQWVEYE